MPQLAKGYTDPQIEARRRWFAAQKAAAMSRARRTTTMTMRRDFLKVSGATRRSPPPLPGCATTGSGSAGRVVVVGGGYGGATAAKYLRMWSNGGVDVTLVEPNAQFVSCPISNLVLGGSKTIADVTVSYDNLVKRHGVKLVKDTAVAVDPDKRTVTLAAGQMLPYDRLILSPGIDFMYEQLKALESADAQARVLHSWKAGPQTVALRRQLEAMPDGGVYAIIDSRRAVPLPARARTSAPARSRGTSSRRSRSPRS